MISHDATYASGVEAGKKFGAGVSEKWLTDLISLYRLLVDRGHCDHFFAYVGGIEDPELAVVRHFDDKGHLILFWKRTIRQESEMEVCEPDFVQGWLDGALACVGHARDWDVRHYRERQNAAAYALRKARASGSTRDVREWKTILDQSRDWATSARADATGCRAIANEACDRIESRLPA